MDALIIVTAVVAVVGIVFLLFRTSILLGIIKRSGVKEDTEASNNRTASLLLIFLFLFIGGFWYYFFAVQPDLLPESSSIHGDQTDQLFFIAVGIILVPFTVLNILIFYASYKFRYNKNRKARYYPENNKLEIIWTVVPGIVFAVLILLGTQVWTNITREVPKDHEVVNVMGYQFAWAVRYPGPDGKLGARDYLQTDASNAFGMDLTDQNAYDDFIPLEMHIPKGKPVLLNIIAKDVIHSVFMPHFRLKMDAVPGMPTRFWFTAKYTTEEMRVKLGDPDFNYEMACTEICGRGHFAMRMIVIVDELDEYQEWKSNQKSWLSQNPEYLDQVPDELVEVARIKSGLESTAFAATK